METLPLVLLALGLFVGVRVVVHVWSRGHAPGGPAPVSAPRAAPAVLVRASSAPDAVAFLPRQRPAPAAHRPRHVAVERLGA